jgi:hypothetical protein
MRIIIGVLALTSTVAAHEGHEHGSGSGTLTGEVVDITCLVDHGSKGAQHSTCAQKCIAKGLPVGLLVGDKLYLVILGSHDSPNATLAPLAGKMVTMTGAISQQHGVRVIDMESVAPAKASSN